MPRSFSFASALAAILYTFVFTLVSPAGTFAQQEAQPAQRIVYSIKFLCGPSSEAFQEGVVSGLSATVITLLNPELQTAVEFSKRVSRALPYQKAGAISDAVSGQIGPMQAISVECNEIRQLLPSQMTSEFRTGYLSIVSAAPLIVTAAYSARPANSDVSTIDIETIEGRKIAAVPDPGKRTDLIIKDIDMAALRVQCPTGGGSCVTTVPVTVANIGSVDAGGFRVQVRLDPGLSVTIDRDLPGLAAGSSETIIIQTPPGGNCFDPDCTVCAKADQLNAVPETNENNNSMCRIRGG